MKIPRWAKIAAMSAVIVTAVVAAGLYLYVRTIDFGRYAERVSAEIKSSTGREFGIGKLNVRLIPGIQLVAEDVLFGNAPWGMQAEMVRIKRLEGRVSIFPLLQRRIEIGRLEVVDAKILIEQNADGTGNWVLGTQPAGETGDQPDDQDSFALAGLRNVRVEESEVTVRLSGMKAPLKLGVRQLLMKTEKHSGEDTFELTAVFRGQPFSLKGRNGKMSRVLNRDSSWPLDFEFQTEGATAKIETTFDWHSSPPLSGGAIEIDIEKTDGLEKLLAVSLQLPMPVKLSARVKSDGGLYVVDPFAVGGGAHTVNGTAAVQTGGDRPTVKAELKATSLDLSRRESSGGAAGRAGGRVFSDTPFPLHALNALDAHVEAQVDHLILTDDLPVESLHLTAVLREGRLEILPLTASIGGGEITANLTLAAADGREAFLKIKAEGKGISGERLAVAMGHSGSLSEGNTDFAIDLAGPGASLAEFMAGADGEVRVVVGPAVIAGAALRWGGDAVTRLLDLVNPFHRTEKNTQLRCLVLRLPSRGGIMTIDRSIAAETDRLNVAAAGQIDLQNETINLAFKTKVNEGIGIGAVNLAELVKLTGTFSNPTVGVDTMASARTALSAGGAIVTGGLSLIGEAFFRKADSDPHPCRTALANGGSKSTAGSGEINTGSGKKKDGGVLDSLKNLFR